MAALIAALGLTSAAATPPAEASVETKGPASTNASPTRSATYFEKLATNIVATAPVFGKARVPIIASHRDKESLMCEIIDLKKALEDTEIHLHMHKQHYLKSLEESRRLEREIEELELRGNYAAPRTGGVVRLESRFKGLGAQCDVLEEIVAERKYGELAELRKDLGATHSRETEVERDTVAAEISRLRIYLKHMKLLTEEAKEDNDNLKFCKRQLARLAVENPRVQRAVDAQKAMVKRARDEIAQLKKEGEEAVARMKQLAKKDKVLDAKLEELRPKAEVADREKRKLVRQKNQLGFDQMIFNQDFRKEHPGVLLA